MVMGRAMAQFIGEAKAGLVVPPENQLELAMAIRKLGAIPSSHRAQMGQRGRDHLNAHFSKRKVIPQYEGILQQASHQVGS